MKKLEYIMRRRRWREGGANVVKFTIFQLSPMEECRVCRWCCGAYWLVCDLDFCVYEEGNTVFLCSSFTASSFLKFLILEEISRAILFPIWGIPTLGFGAWGYNCVVLFCIFFFFLGYIFCHQMLWFWSKEQYLCFCPT